MNEIIYIRKLALDMQTNKSDFMNPLISVGKKKIQHTDWSQLARLLEIYGEPWWMIELLLQYWLFQLIDWYAFPSMTIDPFF